MEEYSEDFLGVIGKVPFSGIFNKSEFKNILYTQWQQIDINSQGNIDNEASRQKYIREKMGKDKLELLREEVQSNPAGWGKYESMAIEFGEEFAKRPASTEEILPDKYKVPDIGQTPLCQALTSIEEALDQYRKLVKNDIDYRSEAMICFSAVEAQLINIDKRLMNSVLIELKEQLEVNFDVSINEIRQLEEQGYIHDVKYNERWATQKYYLKNLINERLKDFPENVPESLNIKVTNKQFKDSLFNLMLELPIINPTEKENLFYALFGDPLQKGFQPMTIAYRRNDLFYYLIYKLTGHEPTSGTVPDKIIRKNVCPLFTIKTNDKRMPNIKRSPNDCDKIDDIFNRFPPNP